MAIFGHNDVDTQYCIYFSVRLSRRKQPLTDENVDFLMKHEKRKKFTLLGNISPQPLFVDKI